jgi:hypothetical protein
MIHRDGRNGNRTVAADMVQKQQPLYLKCQPRPNRRLTWRPGHGNGPATISTEQVCDHRSRRSGVPCCCSLPSRSRISTRFKSREEQLRAKTIQLSPVSLLRLNQVFCRSPIPAGLQQKQPTEALLMSRTCNEQRPGSWRLVTQHPERNVSFGTTFP